MKIAFYCRVGGQSFGFVLPDEADKLREFFAEHQDKHLSRHGGQLLLCGFPCHCRDPLRFRMVYLHGSLLFGAGVPAHLFGHRLPKKNTDAGMPLLPHDCVASVLAEHSHGRYDRTDGADKLRFFLSGIYYLSFGALYLLHDDNGDNQSCKIPQTRQSDFIGCKGAEFCCRNDVHSRITNGDDLPLFRKRRRLSQNDERYHRRICLRNCHSDRRVYAVAQQKFEKEGGNR